MKIVVYGGESDSSTVKLICLFIEEFTKKYNLNRRRENWRKMKKALR